ncbi:ATP-dependent DNA helicase RecQ [Neisseria subflava]|nr:ATP-dependent DNA helicase RecQ [Neisseria subflava]
MNTATKGQIPAVLIIDLEVDPKTDKPFKIGAFRPDSGLFFEKAFRGEKGFHTALCEMAHLTSGLKWLMGHNILGHDLKYLKAVVPEAAWLKVPVIDTLWLSPLAFPQNPYHRLIKNHKIISSEINSPLADCHACWQLFQDQCTAFGKIKAEKPEEFALWTALSDIPLPYRLSDDIMIPKRDTSPDVKKLIDTIWLMMQDNNDQGRLKVCRTRFLELMKTDIRNPAIYPSLSYALSWLNVSGGNSVLAPWVRHQFPDTARLIAELRDHDCGSTECRYCQDTLNPEAQLQRYFKLPTFRDVKGFDGGQRTVVQSGMKGLHTLAVLPTGGGKSLCYQLPALNRYYRNGGLTIIVSPLQSLMKDQLDGLEKKGATCAAMLNGLVEVVERAQILDKIALGDIGILFVAPEQFRNTSFINAISQRQINGWVFDEAHCLSKWGHDFRPDYLYAVKFIAEHSKNNGTVAPVSCFTATAKPDVLADITNHFREEAGIEFRQFIGDNERDNLFYDVLEISDGLKKQKINELLHRELDHQSGGAVVFVGRRKSAETYSAYLKEQGWACEHFHAGLGNNEKADIQNQFIGGSLRVIVATNAFGMGVDKPDVRLVIHAEITGSLENYLQEAGRAGRDQVEAKCVLLYDGKDVDTQFSISKMSQIELRDLKSVWKKVGWLNQAAYGKDHCGEIVATGGEILRDTEEYMSFDSDDRQADTKVKTVLAWLERADLLERKENQTHIFPARSGRLNLDEALAIIEKNKFSKRISEIYQTIAEIVFKAPEDAPLSTDDLVQATACSFTELRGHLKKLEELGILTNDTHMTVILRTDNIKPADKRLAQVIAYEEKLWQILKNEIPEADQGIWQNLSLSAVCYQMHEVGLETNPAEIKLLMQSLADDKAAERTNSSGSFQIRDVGNNLLKIRFKNPKSDSWENLQNNAELRRNIGLCLLPFLMAKTNRVRQKDVMVETRMGELVQQLADDLVLSVQIPADRRELLLRQTLLFMHKQGIIKLNHGMTILRHAMTITPNPKALSAKRQYLAEDYKPLSIFYGEKRFQIHVMQEYALRALKNLTEGLNLVRDYFGLEEKIFKNKWFKGRLKELDEPASPQTLREITDGLNEMQKAVVTDQSGSNRLILAGPGSGKTRVIVHRVAYLLRVQHIPASAIIVLTFNRLAAQEVKRRLFGLVGPLAAAVTVMTYDGMAMRLLGVRFDGNNREYGKSQFKEWCRQAAAMLSDDLENDDGSDETRERIMAGFRYILVDEYQDISEEHYRLVSALAGRKRAEEDKLTILAVGDDDQNIYAFNGTSNEYIHRFQKDYDVAQPDYLTYNYRSTQYIISAANSVINGMTGRLKTLHPIVINPERQTQPNGGVWASTDSERQGRVRHISLPFGNSNIQAQAVITEIGRLKTLSEVAWNEIAVLSRHNASLKPLQAWCEQNGIPYFLSADKSSKIKLRHTREFVRLIDGVEKQTEGFTSQAFAELISEQVKKSGGSWCVWFRQLQTDFLNEYPLQDEKLPEKSDNLAESREAEIQASPIEDNGSSENGSGNVNRYSSAFLKSWLYEYVGDEHETRSEGIFLGTAHAVKGLEFKHVFILDGGWQGVDEAEQRLYYVAMTRAIETLTLLQTTPEHPWVAKLPDDIENVAQIFTELPELNTEYRRLAAYRNTAVEGETDSKSDLDIDFIVCHNNVETVKQRLFAAAKLKKDDPLEMKRTEDGRYIFLSDDIEVARTVKLPPLPTKTTAYANTFRVRYLDEVGESFRQRIPEKIGTKKLEKWTLVIPMLVIPPE